METDISEQGRQGKAKEKKGVFAAIYINKQFQAYLHQLSLRATAQLNTGVL